MNHFWLSNSCAKFEWRHCNAAHRAHTTNFNFLLSHTFPSSYKNTRPMMISEEEKNTVLQLEKLRRKAEGGERRKYTRLNEKASHRIVARCSVEFKCFLRQLLKRFIRARSETLEFHWLLDGGVLNLDLIVLSWKKISWLEVKKLKCDKKK